MCRRLLAWPERKTFVVLGGEGDVSCAGAREDVSPVFWIEQFRSELWGEVLVGKVSAVNFLMIGPAARFDGILGIVFAFGDSVPIPFGVGEFAWNNGRISGYGEVPSE